MTGGWRSFRRSGATHRMAQLLGAIAHLWRLPVYQSTPSAGRSSASAPGPWAPSTSTGTPAAWQRAAIAATGRMTALLEVT